MTVRTRFAPSPTGYLHIGGARTALFNYLFAKHYNGKFLLRIEDTDKARSTKEATEEILKSMEWLGLSHDKPVIYQSTRAQRHREIAEKLVEKGEAYYCFSSQEEIGALRDKAIASAEHFIFHSPWRDKATKDYPVDVKPVIRLKAPRAGQTITHDLVQGKVVVDNSHLDDMVLLKSDGNPTYMLAVVVDDHDMGITHIIRGDDHLNNALRQQLIYNAMGWDIPQMVHIPLIHGPDGSKLSKRHGALAVSAYKETGYLPEAINNYLLRLGWAHGDNEIISQDQAIKWFDGSGIGRSPARMDFNKMKYINAHYLRALSDEALAELILNFYEDKPADRDSRDCIKQAIGLIKPRITLLVDAAEISKIFILNRRLPIEEEAMEIINSCPPDMLKQIIEIIESIENFTKENIQSTLKHLAEKRCVKLAELMKYIRAFITGKINSPSVFEIMEIIGKAHSLNRLKNDI